MLEKVINLLRQNQIQVPRILFTKYRELKISDEEFIILMYLLNSDKILDPKKVSKDLKIELPKVFETITSLEEKDILSIQTYQNQSIREEALNFDGLYDKLAFFIINDKDKQEDTNNLFDLFEKEFARPLSPMEFEIINGWKEQKYNDELIEIALKEAIYNGVSNLRYIDKILYEWKKKGITNKEDVEKNKKEFHKNKETKQELYDYDWLNEHE